MANKIVQLVDNESNNIFPVAGSMAGDSVTTQMIQDGAVTSDKIDFTTIGTDITSDITWAETPLSAQATLILGNYVLINYMGDSRTHAVGQNIATVPAEYKPAANTFTPCGYGGNIGNIVLQAADGKINCNATFGGATDSSRANFTLLYKIA